MVSKASDPQIEGGHAVSRECAAAPRAVSGIEDLDGVADDARPLPRAEHAPAAASRRAAAMTSAALKSRGASARRATRRPLASVRVRSIDGSASVSALRLRSVTEQDERVLRRRRASARCSRPATVVDPRAAPRSVQPASAAPGGERRTQRRPARRERCRGSGAPTCSRENASAAQRRSDAERGAHRGAVASAPGDRRGARTRAAPRSRAAGRAAVGHRPASPARCRASTAFVGEQVGIEARVARTRRGRARPSWPAGFGLASERLRGPNRWRIDRVGEQLAEVRSPARRRRCGARRRRRRGRRRPASSAASGIDDRLRRRAARRLGRERVDAAALAASRRGASRPRSNSPSSALKTSLQRPQRTQPSETLSWSWTTRNVVPQEVQRVARLIAKSCHAASAGSRRRSSGSSRRPRRRPRGEPRRIGRLQLVGLALEDAGQHQLRRPARRAPHSSGASSLSGVGQDVGEHQLRSGPRALSGRPACSCDAVGARVGRGRFAPRPDRCRPRRSCARAEPRRADREDARAAAVVEHALAAAGGAGAAIQRRHMRVVGCVPVPKARPGIEPDHLRAPAAGGSCQVGTIQNSGVISHRRELRLREPHPVLRRHRRRCDAACAAGDEVLRLQQRRGLAWRRPRRRTAPARASAASRPSAAACRARRTAACSASVCASASSTETHSASSASQRVADRFDAVLAAHSSAQFDHRAAPTRSALVLRQPALRGSGCWCRRRMNLASTISSRCSGMLVLMPSTTISDSAMRMRAIACSRVSPCTMILPIIES